MKQPNFDAMIEVHRLLNELPKVSEVFIKHRTRDETPTELVKQADADGLAQMILFAERICDLKVPKSWHRWAKVFHRKAAHRLALSARNPLDRLAAAE
jgi:hypothetical protein